VLWLQPNGSASVANDRCCHRSARLSGDWIKNKGSLIALTMAGNSEPMDIAYLFLKSLDEQYQQITRSGCIMPAFDMDTF
jgi:hypothetical protein